jgi:hypothetical protein
VQQDFAQYLVEWGWVGGGAWIALWCLGIFHGLRWFWNRLRAGHAFLAESWIHLAALAALAGVVLHALVDFPLQSPALLGVALFALAVTLSRLAGTRIRG